MMSKGNIRRLLLEEKPKGLLPDARNPANVKA